jgi:3-methyladenine DNA glycosylase AlkC
MPARGVSRINHPAERFVAPGSIETGASLAELVGEHSITLLAESLVSVAPGFDGKRFAREAKRSLEGLGLMQRGAAVGAVLCRHLPPDFEQAMQVLVASLGPELVATEKNGMAPFFYLPHSFAIAEHPQLHWKSGLGACYELTKRFTAEFCIRVYLDLHPDECLEELHVWISDENPHVRRLVSEGTRTRLPWGRRLKRFQADPSMTLPLLERLKDDPEAYVQRSVANHLGDMLKDNPEMAYATCERWLAEAQSVKFPADMAKRRLWIVRHALRLPAKKGVPKAVRLRRTAGWKG